MSNTTALPDADKAALKDSQTQLPEDTINEYEDSEENFQPKTLKFWIVIIAIYLSLFLVILVS